MKPYVVFGHQNDTTFIIIGSYPNSINYIVPENVGKISNSINKQNGYGIKYVVFRHQNNTTFMIVANCYKLLRKLRQLFMNSHRYLVINSSMRLPVCLVMYP